MAGSHLDRIRRFLFPSIAVVVILILIGSGLWSVERIPSVLRERLFLRVANLSNGAVREPQEFDFIVVGHLYGSPGIDDQMPARLLLRRLPDILETEPDFMVSLGDMVFRRNQIEFENLDKALLQKLTFPFYPIPGNHDVANDRRLYKSYFGARSYFGMDHGPAHLIFLDTEQADCGFNEPQLEFLSREIETALADPETRFILIFMHKALVFQSTEMRSQRNKQAMPNVWDCQNRDDANPLMENIFRPAAKHKPVVIFAGDVGAWGNLSPYYQRDPWLPLTLVMTGLGDSPQDNIVRVHVSPTGLRMEAVFLEDMQSIRLEGYDLEYWLNVARGNDRSEDYPDH